MIGKPYRSYVAIGDSLSEGLGDFDFGQRRLHQGWTDRLAGLIGKETEDIGHEFHYANLAIRGSDLEKIISMQLPAALRLQPDLVTVMAGSNDLMSSVDRLSGLREMLRDGVQQLLAAGCDVVLVNTINPLHLRVFRPVAYRATRVTAMIESVAKELNVPVLDVFRIESLRDLCFWAEDMVHFSGHGHILIANRAAKLLGLNYRFREQAPSEMSAPNRSLISTLQWVRRDVIPFFERKAQGRTSGDGMDPKLPTLAPFAPLSSWDLELLSADSLASA